MKTYSKIILLAAIFIFPGRVINAQQKKAGKITTAKIISEKPVDKFTPLAFGAPVLISDVTDVKEANPEYLSLKNLIETNGVTIVYDDNTFRPKEALRRGDFLVSFNAALDVLKKTTDALGLDSSLIELSNKNQPSISSAGEIKDLKQSSIYYPAVQSLIEQWGITAPFTKSRLVNASAAMPEEEVYEILKTTFGYYSPGLNPYSTAITRSKFAIVLNNALNQKLTQVKELLSLRQESAEALNTQQQVILKQQEKQKKDSLYKVAELSKIDMLRKEAEAWSKRSNGEKRKQLKNQPSK